ncbi:MAG: putative DNA binding domain-containing protein [Atopobiaceae bacterium]|nr:putative DNA binding domain-containing protein [Atopobiaceae bacterium]
MAFLDRLDNLGEDQHLEFKESAFDVPDDVWESYSAFANTEGGEIVLGVTENDDHTFTVTGVVEPDRLVTDFWTTVRNRQKVDRDVLFADSVRAAKVQGLDVIIINVPRAERGEKPVKVKTRKDKQFTAWIRRGSSDVRATKDDLRQMDYDNAERADRAALDGFSISAFNPTTIERYRNVFAGNKPSSPWNKDSNEDFLFHIGALARGHDGKLRPTQAGLLAFGNEYEITNFLPHFLLDYRQQSLGSARWDDRIVSQDDEWSGNLIDFYFDVTARLLRSLRSPFTTDETGTRHGVRNPVAEAVNEAVSNALVHAYYGGRSSIIIVLDEDALTITNPGSFLVDRDVAIAGGMSEQRNPTLMRIFWFVGASDRAGSGLQTIFETWRDRFDELPVLTEEHAPSLVRISLPLPEASPLRGGSSVPKRRRAKLDDDKLYAFLASSKDGVSSEDVSMMFGVSARVAQKHLAALYADPARHVSRDEASAPYVYFVKGAERTN